MPLQFKTVPLLQPFIKASACYRPHHNHVPFLSPSQPLFLSSSRLLLLSASPEYLCGPTLPLNSNSTHKQTALHAVITDPKLPDIKRATFHPTAEKRREEKEPRGESSNVWASSCSIGLPKCDQEGRQIAMEEEHIFEGFHIGSRWSKCSAAFVANCGDYL